MGTAQMKVHAIQQPTARERFWRSIEVASSPSHVQPSDPRHATGVPAGAAVGHVVAECCDQALSLLRDAGEPLTADEVLGIVRAIGSLGSGTDPRTEVQP